MNKITLPVLALFLFIAVFATAKGYSGVYLTAEDFKTGKLTYRSDCSAKASNIHLHDFFRAHPIMTVKADGKWYTLKKSAVFGYRDCNGALYRLYKNNPYRICEADHIIIYSRQRNIAQSKGFRIVTDYFFSVAADSALMPLTVTRLRIAYQDNTVFTGLLETAFLNSEPYEYDRQHTTFKVNYLLSKTISATHDQQAISNNK